MTWQPLRREVFLTDQEKNGYPKHITLAGGSMFLGVLLIVEYFMFDYGDWKIIAGGVSLFLVGFVLTSWSKKENDWEPQILIWLPGLAFVLLILTWAHGGLPELLSQMGIEVTYSPWL